MPHIIIEHSDNFNRKVQQVLVKGALEAAIESSLFWHLIFKYGANLFQLFPLNLLCMFKHVFGVGELQLKSMRYRR